MTRTAHITLLTAGALAVSAAPAVAMPAFDSPADGTTSTVYTPRQFDTPSAQPVNVAPAPDGGTDVLPWVLIGVPVALVAGAGGIRLAGRSSARRRTLPGTA